MSHDFTPELARSGGLPEDRFPQTMEEAVAVQDVLSRELENLTLEDHDKAIFDVHGIVRVVEHPETVQSKLEELHVELMKDSAPFRKDSYREAWRLGPTYVRSLYLRFLRAENYDIGLAAEKMAQYFEVKRELFGRGEILARDVRQSDLSPGDLKFLEAGFLQLSSTRDSSGRGVVFMVPMIDDVNAMNRMVFYWGTITLHDEDIQRNGIVAVFYNYENLTADKKYIGSIFRVEKSLPVRILCWHYCFTDDKLFPFVKGIQLFAPRHDRFRMCEHLGSPKAIESRLKTFGIPTDTSPIGRDGTWNTTLVIEQLKVQRVKEEEIEKASSHSIQRNTIPNDSDTGNNEVAQNQDAVISPGRFDVLMGKSGCARDHTGNRRAVHLCEMIFDKYETAGKYQKTDLAEGVLSTIRESGGRFLKWMRSDTPRWVEADDLAARQKIAHFFRYIRSKTKGQKKHP